MTDFLSFFSYFLKIFEWLLNIEILGIKMFVWLTFILIITILLNLILTMLDNRRR